MKLTAVINAIGHLPCLGHQRSQIENALMAFMKIPKEMSE